MDFQYADPGTGAARAWKWPGKGSYKIADIMAELGVTGEISQVSLKRTEDVGGAENVLYLSEDGTALVSDAAFLDTFELTVVVDGKTYVLTVTDDVLDRGVTVDTYFLTTGHVQNAEAESGEPLNARVALSDSNPNPVEGNFTYVKVSIQKDPDVILDGYWQDGTESQIIIQNGAADPTVIYYTYHENGGQPYIIYKLPAGATGVVDLPFKTPNGTTPDGTHVTIAAEFVDSTDNPVQGAANDSVSAPATGTWTSEFKWDDIEKTVNSEVQHLTADNKLNDWLKYTFSANTLNKSETGAMWTDTITLTDTLTLPEGLAFKSTGTGSGTPTSAAVNFECNGEHVFGLAGLTGLEIEGTPVFTIVDSSTLTYELTLRNPNRDANGKVTAEMNSFHYQAEFNLGSLNMTEDFITAAESDPRPTITNTVNVTETAWDHRTQTSSDTVTTQIKANEGYELTKTSNKDGGTVQSGDTIEYTVSLTNTGSVAFSEDDGDARYMRDQLPNAIEITDAQFEAVQIKLYDVSGAVPAEITLTPEDLAALRGKLSYDKNSNRLQFDAAGLEGKRKIEFVYSATVKDPEALQYTAEGTTISNLVQYKEAHPYTSTTLKKPHYHVDKVLTGTKGSESDPAANGDVIVYKLTATADQGAVGSVVMYDTLPAYMRLMVYDAATHEPITNLYTDRHYKEDVYRDVCISDGHDNFYAAKVKTDWQDRAYLRIEKSDGLVANESVDYYYQVEFDADSAVYNVDQNGYVRYTNIVTTPNGDKDEAEFVGGYGKLTVDKSHNPKGIKDGQEITSPYKDDTLLTYYVTVNNDANNPYTKDITVHDEIPAGLFPVVVIPESGAEATKAELEAYVTDGNYHNITINGVEAQIKKFNNGYDIVWVIQNPQTSGGTDYITSKKFSYQARIVVDDIILNAAGYAQLQNRAWVPGSEKYDVAEVKENGLEMDKIAIESDPHLLVEDRLVKIQPGSVVTYRLTLTNPTSRDIVANDVTDILPKWPELSPLPQSHNYWNSTNVSYDKTSPDCFDQNFASIYDTGSEVSNGKITWKRLKVPARQTLTTVVTVTFPDSVNLATAMFEKEGHDTHNVFHVLGLEDKMVDHIMAVDRKFDLRKSVVGFTKLDPHLTGSNAYNGNSRDIFKKGTVNEVTYAVAFANTGASTIHLRSFQDDLPNCLELISVYGNAQHWCYCYAGIGNNGYPNLTTSYFGNEYVFDSNVLDQNWDSSNTQFSVVSDGKTGTINFTLEDGAGIDVPPRKVVVFHLRCKIKDGQENLFGIDSITNSIRATMDGDADIKSTKLIEKWGTNINIQNSGDCVIVDKSNGTTTAQSSVTIHPLDIFVPGIRKQATRYKAFDRMTESSYANEWTAVTSDHEQNFNSRGLVEWTVTLYNDGTEDINEGYTVTDNIPMGHHLTRATHGSEAAFVTSYVIYGGDGAVVSTVPADDPVFLNAVISQTDSFEGGKTATFEFGTDEKYVIPAGGRAEMKLVTDFIGAQIYMGQIKNNATFIPTNQDWNANLVTKGQLVKNEDGDRYIGVTSSDYINAYGDYATSSNKKVEAVDDASNSAYGYEDINYITVPVGTTRVKYTLQVCNLASNALTDFVIIDRVPEIGDVGVINQIEQRGSEFAIGMVASGLKVYVKDSGEDGDVHDLSAASGAYSIQYSAKTSYSDADLDGTETEGWHDTLQAGDKSFRIILDKEHTDLTDTTGNKIVIPKSGGKVFVEYYGSIDSNAAPGQVAYNSFGYWFKNTRDDHALAEPPKVGVMIERQPSIQKQVLDENDQPLPADPTKAFEFNFYDVTDAGDISNLTAEKIQAMTTEQLAAAGIVPVSSVNPLTLTQGTSADLVKRQTINGTPRGDFIDGHTYLVIEAPCDGYFSVGYTVDGLKKSDGQMLTFVYDSANRVTVIALNREEVSGWEPEAVKTLITRAGTPLAANRFSFTLYAVANYGETNETATPVETVSNDGNGKVTFTRIEYQQPGTYWYRMQEVAGQDDSVVYDGTLYDVKVEVQERFGRLMAKPTYYKNGNALPAGSVPGFVNRESTRIQVEKVWEGDVTSGSATMVLYRTSGQNAEVPTDKFLVTLNAALDHTPAGSGYVDVTYTGDGGDSGTIRLNNADGWTGRTVTLNRGEVYTFVWAADGSKVTSVITESVDGVSDARTINLNVEAKAAEQYDYTFTVPEDQRPANNRGSVVVTMNGESKTLNSASGWAASFSLTEESTYTFEAVPGDGFVTNVAPGSGSITAGVGDRTIPLDVTPAAQTMDVPVSVTWDTAPDEGTAVTVTFTHDSTTETVTLNSPSWSTEKTLARLNDSGNLITWNVSADVTGADNASVSGAPATISGSGSVALDGHVARGMNLTIIAGPQTNLGDMFKGSVDSNGHITFKAATKRTLEGYGKTTAFESLDVKDGSNTIYYIIRIWSGTMTITTNAEDVGVDTKASETDNYTQRTAIWIKAQPGDVVVKLENNSEGWNIVQTSATALSANRSMASGMPRLAVRASGVKGAAPALTTIVDDPTPLSSAATTFADTSVGGVGTPFKVIQGKDLPSGAVPASDEQTISGGTYTWSDLPAVDAEGNPIYYFVVEKEADAIADEMSVRYAYTYNTAGDPTSGISKVTITNTTVRRTGSLTVTKSVSGTAEGTYSIAVKNSAGHYFDLDGQDKGTDASYVTFSKDQSKTWSNLLPDTYTVEEANADVDGYTWTVSGTGDIAVSAGPTATKTVTNTYTRHIPYAPKVTKTLTGRAWKTGDSFTFTLAQDTAQDGVTMPANVTATVTGSSAGHTESFDSITFTAAGNYTFTVTETVPGDASNGTYTWAQVEAMEDAEAKAAAKAAGGFKKDGVTYDGAPKTLTVVVEEGANHELGITGVTVNGTAVTAADAIAAASTEVTNTYTADGKVPFAAKKALTGGTLSAGQFTFTLTEYTDGTFETVKDGGVSQRVTNAAPAAGASFAQVLFSDVALSSTDTRYFIITEPVAAGVNDDGDIVYDTHAQKITVAVTDDGEGNLVPGKTYDPAFAEEDYDAAFTNVKKGGLVIRKQVTEGSSNAAQSQVFSFEVFLYTQEGSEVTPYAGTVKVKDRTHTSAAPVTLATNDAGKLTVTIQGEGTAEITGILAGTRYTVTETSLPDGWSRSGEIVYTTSTEGGTANLVLEAGETETATVTNTEVTGISVTKAWKDVNPTKLSSITYTLTRALNGASETETVTVEKNANSGINGFTVSVNGAPAVPKQETGWGYSWSDLPVYGRIKTASAGNGYDADQYTDPGEFTYSVEETEFVYDGVTYLVRVQQDGSYKVFVGDDENETWIWNVDRTDNGFTNKLRTDFEFTKEWYDNFDMIHNGWLLDSQLKDVEIAVTLTRRLRYGDNNTLSSEKDPNFNLNLGALGSSTDTTMTITDQGDNLTLRIKAEPVQMLVGTETVTVYKFCVSGLQKDGTMTIGGEEKQGTWVYYASEASVTVDGELYTTAYLDKDGNARDGDTEDEGVIRNTKHVAYELPSTGGPGTSLFYVLGSVLTILAAVLLIARKRSDDAEIE